MQISKLIQDMSKKIDAIDAKKALEGEVLPSKNFTENDKPPYGSFEWKLWVLRKSVEACMYFDDTNGRYVIIDGRTLVACMQEMNKMEGHYAQLPINEQSKLSDTVSQVRQLINNYRKEY